MKKILLLTFLALILITPNAIGQNKKNVNLPLAAYKVGSLWHFIGHQGNEIFPPQELIEVNGYSEGFFRVKKVIDGKERICYLNIKGEVAIVPDCDKSKNFSDGMAVIMKYTNDAHDDMTYGFINKEGRQVLDTKYADASDFERGMAYVLDKDKRGYIDKTGNYLLLLQNSVGSPFHEGMASVTNQHYKCGFINKNGDLVIEYLFDEAGYFSEGLAVVGMNGKYGYVNKKGEFIINPLFDYAMPFREDRAVVGKLDNSFRIHWGFIDKTGTATVKELFDEAKDFSEGLSSVRKDKKWGFVSKDGEFVIENKFGSSDSFVNDLAWANDTGQNVYGFIDKTGIFKIKLPQPEIVIDLRLNRVVYGQY